MKMSKRHYELLFFVVAVVLAVFRFSYSGLEYTAYLDDYVQYSYYPQLRDSWNRVYAGGAGVLFTRPLAGLFDLVLWSNFWGNLGIAVAVISVLHGLSAVLCYKAFNLCGMRVGAIFVVIYILMPLNIEATYWLSASSRIVVSMFFASTGAYFGAKKNMWLFFLFSFVSIWFYEQTAILSLAVALWICIRIKRPIWMLFHLISAALLGIFYLKFGLLGDNAQRLSAVSYAEIVESLLRTAESLVKIFTEVLYKLMTKGFVRGFRQIAFDFSLLWLGCLLLLAILFFILSQKVNTSEKKYKHKLTTGVIFLLAPLMPFCILGEAELNLRNIAPCILGLAIVIDRFALRFPQRYICVFGVILVFWLSTVTVSEVEDYNYTARQDFKLAAQISDNVSADTQKVKVRISTPKYYVQNAPYHDHIMSMTGSDWGLTGIVRTLSKNENVVVEVKS